MRVKSVRKDEIFIQMVLELHGVREWVDLTFQILSYVGFGESEQPLCEDSMRELDQVQLRQKMERKFSEEIKNIWELVNHGTSL